MNRRFVDRVECAIAAGDEKPQDSRHALTGEVIAKELVERARPGKGTRTAQVHRSKRECKASDECSKQPPRRCKRTRALVLFGELTTLTYWIETPFDRRQP
jgi:hypothetical protein